MFWDMLDYSFELLRLGQDMLVIQVAQPEDAAAITAIYNEGIRGRSATFETHERTTQDILAWFNAVQHPLLVAKRGGEVMGWIHASTYRTRECYAGIAEFSVYVAGRAQGQGVGNTLMAAFIPVCEQAGFWKLVSRIFIENTASRQLCQKHGFREVGVYEKHGKLDGVWRDVVIVERLLEANLD